MPSYYKDSAAYISPESLNFTKSMQKYWFNFASNHDPNIGESVDVEWPSFAHGDEDDMLLLNYEMNSVVMDNDPKCAFFDSIGYVPPYQYPQTVAPTSSPTTNTATTDITNNGEYSVLRCQQ